MTRANVLLFLSLEAWTLISIAILVGSDRLGFLPERARRSARVFLLVMLPPYLIVLQVIAFSVLFGPPLA